MLIGAMRSRIEIQEEIQTGRNSFGEPEITWATTKTLWASIVNNRDMQRYTAKQEQSESEWTIKTRYYPDASAGNRIKFKNRIFEIEGFHHPYERQKYTHFHCREVVE